MASSLDDAPREIRIQPNGRYSHRQLLQYLRGDDSTTKAMTIDAEDFENLLRSSLSELDDDEPSTPEMTEPALAETEKEKYEDLVSMGGRPIHPVHFLDSDNVIKHHDMSWPWTDRTGPSGETKGREYHYQRDSWRIFRAWQVRFRRLGRQEPRSAVWKRFVEDFDLADGGIDEYSGALQRLLRQCGFRRPFRLQEDPKRQDKVTEWIEYLGYECAVLYHHWRTLKLLRPNVDEAWRKLVEAKGLLPHKTREYILGHSYGLVSLIDTLQAKQATESAISAARRPVPEANVAADRTQGDSREQHHKTDKAASERGGEIEIKSEKEAKNNAKLLFLLEIREFRMHWDILLKRKKWCAWVRNQLPLIEAEMAHAAADPPGERGVKRKHTGEEDSP